MSRVEGLETIFECEECGHATRILNAVPESRLLKLAEELEAAERKRDYALKVLNDERNKVAGWKARAETSEERLGRAEEVLRELLSVMRSEWVPETQARAHSYLSGTTEEGEGK